MKTFRKMIETISNSLDALFDEGYENLTELSKVEDYLYGVLNILEEHGINNIEDLKKLLERG